MKKQPYFLAITLLILSLIACTTPAYIQKADNVKLANYKTYMWVDTKANEKDSTAKASAYAEISIHNAVANELQKFGWKEVNDNPDAVIGYDILVERSSQTKSDPVYSQSFTRSYYNRFTGRWNTIYYPSQFLGYDNYEVPVKESTVTISIMDAKTDKAIWQGWTSENMNYNRLKENDINSSVKRIFKKFNPS